MSESGGSSDFDAFASSTLPPGGSRLAPVAESSKRSRRVSSPEPWAVVLATGRAVRLRRWIGFGLAEGCHEPQPAFPADPSDESVDSGARILRACRDTRWH